MVVVVDAGVVAVAAIVVVLITLALAVAVAAPAVAGTRTMVATPELFDSAVPAVGLSVAPLPDVNVTMTLEMATPVFGVIVAVKV